MLNNTGVFLYYRLIYCYYIVRFLPGILLAPIVITFVLANRVIIKPHTLCSSKNCWQLVSC